MSQHENLSCIYAMFYIILAINIAVFQGQIK